MISKMRSAMRGEEGFTLIELMIVVAIIGILAAVAVPNFMSYRDRSRVAAAKATMQSVRAALAVYAADDPDNLFPDAIANYGALQALVDPLGSKLPATPGSTGISSIAYVAAADQSDYTFTVITTATASVPGATFTVTPGGITNAAAGGGGGGGGGGE